MQTTTISQLGNSNAVILPSPIMKEAKWRRGQKMTIDYVPEADGIFIRSAKKTTTSSRPQEEFQEWLDTFLKEDAELLDELANR
jgi:antitoxin component of MazEF toxin-antitoxin module